MMYTSHRGDELRGIASDGVGNIIVSGTTRQSDMYGGIPKTPSTFGDVVLSNIGGGNDGDAVMWKIYDNTFVDPPPFPPLPPPSPPFPPPIYLPPAPTLQFAPTFSCPFTATKCTTTGKPACPCYARECGSTSRTTIAFKGLDPWCMHVTLTYCRSQLGAGQTACEDFRTKKQATRAFGRNSGGVIDTDTPELGGRRSKMRVPRGALKADKFFGMGEMDEANIRATLPGRQRRKSSLIALTPHGETFNAPVVVEIPYEKSSTGVLKVRHFISFLIILISRIC